MRNETEIEWNKPSQNKSKFQNFFVSFWEWIKCEMKMICNKFESVQNSDNRLSKVICAKKKMDREKMENSS